MRYGTGIGAASSARRHTRHVSTFSIYTGSWAEKEARVTYSYPISNMKMQSNRGEYICWRDHFLPIYKLQTRPRENWDETMWEVLFGWEAVPAYAWITSVSLPERPR